ncbi:hypothetical protein RND71_019161 [Anisodus tanguticus]|uniref:ENHANCER OF AG-4 protein 2 n=1 Tax=Anisodus tanguticus TaxID=243964 RepID=A0AAE1RWZ6_9SOLA|nr:hypothetical protein RND71_019161 [Anisodus tanguticus]
MAPGRKRGFKGVKTMSELSLGDLVLAKVKGFPAWPAKISKPEDWDRAPDPKKYFVQFFGTEEIAFVAPADITAFTVDIKNKVSARCRGKTVKYFAQAVKEICEEFEELQQKDSSVSGDEVYKTAPGSRIASVERVDPAAELDQMDGIKKSKQETDIKSLVEGSGLERCSMIKNDTADFVSHDSEGNLPPSISSTKKVSIPSRTSNSGKELASLPSQESTHDNQSEDNRDPEEHDKQLIHKGNLRTAERSHFADPDFPPPTLSDDVKQLDGGRKQLTNGHKAMLAKRKPGGGHEVQRISDTTSDLTVKKASAKKLVPEVKSGTNGRKKAKKQDDRKPETADAALDQIEEKKFQLSSKKLKVEPGQMLRRNEIADPSKKIKCADGAIDAAKVSKSYDEAKVVKSEVKKSIPLGRAEDRISLKLHEGAIGSNNFGEEDILPPSKRHRRVMEAMSSSSPVPQLPTKRRAVRLCEDDENEEPKTPIHGGSIKRDAISRVPNLVKKPDLSIGTACNDQLSVKDSGTIEDSSIKEHPPSVRLHKELSLRNSQKNVDKKPIPTDTSVSCSLVKLGFPKTTSKEGKTDTVSPKKSPEFTAKPVSEPQKGAKPPGKPQGDHRKLVAESNTGNITGADNLNPSHDQPIHERSKMASTGERKKTAPSSSSSMTEPALVPGNPVESMSSRAERLEAVRDEKLNSLVESKVLDPEMSMKYLIAAAQAKRRQAHLRSIHGNTLASVAPYTEPEGGNTYPTIGSQPLSSGMLHPEVQVLFSRSSPSSEIQQFPSTNPPEPEENEEKRVSSGLGAAGGSLSGGTEAAVARDAFEGMIETLSRTKESIGRATRLAIDCAKYGIANEVVELLIRKLDNEPSFPHRVDLFYLVDSITQCSHSHKGIAGASYIPAVQAALPRLLGAAAPPGVGARENRRLCLKVLRLWLERKIYPDSLLRRHMDDIGTVNDDSSGGLSFRRPSRAERAIDDPIREMEGMLVDEYGSNATFQLPGFLSSHVFDEEEEDALRNLQNEAAEELAAERTPATGDNSERYTVTPSDRRHCILEDVDGELEMEDVSDHPKDERPLFADDADQSGSDRTLESALDNTPDLPPLPMGSPPLPPCSPPPTPPLPSSPPPSSPAPPPPPSSPLPPPPPPPLPLSQPPLPPSQQHSFPPLPAGPPPPMFPQPSFPLQHEVGTQQLHSLTPSVPSPSPVVAYLQPPVPNEVGSIPSGHRLPQVAGNMPHGPRINAPMRNEVFPSQPPSFTPAGICNSREPSGYSSRPLEYGYNDAYINPPLSLSTQKFQPGNAPFAPRPMHLNPPHQIPSNSFSYPRAPVQQHPQQAYPAPCSLPERPDGSRCYIGDEQWRVQPNEFSGEHQRGMWISAGRSCPGPTIAQEGYFRPPDRPPVSNVGFQPSGSNAFPAGPPISGHGMPCRPDVTSLNWRQA